MSGLALHGVKNKIKKNKSRGFSVKIYILLKCQNEDSPDKINHSVEEIIDDWNEQEHDTDRRQNQTNANNISMIIEFIQSNNNPIKMITVHFIFFIICNSVQKIILWNCKYMKLSSNYNCWI